MDLIIWYNKHFWFVHADTIKECPTFDDFLDRRNNILKTFINSGHINHMNFNMNEDSKNYINRLQTHPGRFQRKNYKWLGNNL